MPPPPWTNNPSGIPLQAPPICKYCAEDLTVLEGSPSTPPQPPPPPLSKPLFRRFPKWMGKLPSNQAKKPAPSYPNLTPMSPSSPPTIHVSTDSCVLSHEESSSKGLLLTRSLSTNVQAKALLGHNASTTVMTRTNSLKKKYGHRAPPYMRELSAVFLDHRGNQGLRSRTKRGEGDEGDDGERGGEG